MRGKIYLADDEKNIRDILKMFLVEEGYDVVTFESGDSFLKKFYTDPCDLAIIDIMMPGIDGFNVCKEIRKISKVPIIMLTARHADSDYIKGFAAGCDDYLTKPYSPVKLVIKVNHIFNKFKESDNSNDNKRVFGDITLDLAKKEAYCREIDFKLTSTEFQLLDYMISKKDEALSREELLKEVWGFGWDSDSRATDDTVKRLRKKLNDADSTLEIVTVWGYGFKLNLKEKV